MCLCSQITPAQNYIMSQLSQLSINSELMNMDIGTFLDDISITGSQFTADTPVQGDVPVIDEIEIADPTGSTVENVAKKLSRGILTFFPPDMDTRWLNPSSFFPNADELFNVWCGQFELAPSTDELHVHIYFEFKTSMRMRFDAFRKNIQNAGITSTINVRASGRASENQRRCAVNYVLKPSKRAPNTEGSVWAGCTVKGLSYDPTIDVKGEKKDQGELQRLHIESKPVSWTWDQIVHESEESKQLLCQCSWGPKYHSGRLTSDARRTIQEVIIMYGAGGTGKTTMAKAWGSDVQPEQSLRWYKRNYDDGHFFGGGATSYKGQSTLIYEEFEGQEPYSRLKEICDIGAEGPSVNIKNGGAILNHSTVIFTSNTHPAGFYKSLWEKDSKQFYPFNRRVTKVLFFPEFRLDGSPNTPDEDNPPYYQDQTEEWKSFGSDYNECVNHAQDVWPLREETDGDGALSNNFHYKDQRNKYGE
jgi:hypothetical protein